MNILIVGLGLIGGSYAKGLSKKGHKVFGVDKNKETLDFAIENGYIAQGSQNAKEYLALVDMVILGLYPTLILDFLKENKAFMRKGLLITDVCGVKTSFLNSAISLALPATYISHHPMAGKEKVGIHYADEHIFIGANFLICNVDNKEEDLALLKQIARDLSFGRVSIISPKYHDKMIGFTSQLTHAIAVSLVNSDTQKDTKKFIGDSYRDLTRIAMINENLWAELFFENKDFLIDEISNFELELSKLKSCLIQNDEKSLKELFVKSREKRKEMDKQ